MQQLFPRLVANRLSRSRLDTPISLLVGARQVGKSTLAALAAETGPNRGADQNAAAGASAAETRYFTLDDATLRASIEADPQGFVERYRGADWTVIDEVQRVPELFVAIKREVDRDRRPGRFLLTCSTSALFLPTMAKELAGRLEIIELWPLAQCEIEGIEPNFLRAVFNGEPPEPKSTETREQTIHRAVRGGYPEAVRREEERRDAWFGSYLTTVIQREVRSLSAIGDEAGMVRVLRALAVQSGAPRRFEAIAHATGIPTSTVKRYADLLEAVYLVRTTPMWWTNVEKRFVKSPKVIPADSGIFAHLYGGALSDASLGLLFENFVGNELLRLSSGEDRPPALMGFRLQNGVEVDFVLETPDGRIVGVEVKASTSATNSDFRGLQALRDIAGDRFACGVVVYCGERTLPFGDRLFSAPVTSLWSGG